ncbi:hypothetical protein [Sodalinema gerasimenkoae]|uniref:hypothetical protein n=1 Tax=Sodalinema gerasimenkoae TaxID=2862348 RepID=UPI001CA54DB3|nr:hypothetical protein [Sodalinema gerasimenkoae]
MEHPPSFAFMQNRPPLLVPLNPNHPHCLDGLDHWLQLDLLDDDQVKRLCHQGLTCPLPAWEPESPATRTVPYRPPVAASPATPDPPPRQRSIAQSLKDELSVRWLLWLGVFVVLVSSAVLAASQWGRVPPAGQYGILWLYTLGFAITSGWLHRRQTLALTAQTLQTIVYGLIPLNFWAMDEFGLWSSPLGWIAIALGSISLGLWLWRQSDLTRQQTALLLLFSLSHWPFYTLPRLSQLGLYLATLGGVITSRQRRGLTQLGIVGYGLASFSGRAILADSPLLSSFSAAWAILAWQLADPQHPRRSRLGAVLFLLAWGLSLSNLAWPVLVITGLALHRLGQRLQRFGKPRDLALTALVGLQGYAIAWYLLPQSLRSNLWNTIQESLDIQSQATVIALLSLPYLLGLLGLTEWLNRQESRQMLSRQGDAGIFLFGLALAVMGGEVFANVWVIWIPLGGLLALTSQRRYSQSSLLATLAQLLVLGGLVSILEWQLDGPLSEQQWGLILLAVALLEGLWANLQQSGRWQTSAWHLTCGLGAWSYLLLVWETPDIEPWSHVGWWWWLMPGGLALASHYGASRYRTQAGWLAIVGAIALQPLPINIISPLRFNPVPALLISLSLGSLVLLVTVRSLKNPWAGLIAVGFGVLLVLGTLSEVLTLWGQNWLSIFALFPLSLWGLQRWGQRRGGELSRLYLRGCHVWGWGTWLIVITLFSVRSVLAYDNPFLPSSWVTTAGLGVLIAAIVVHQGRALNNRGLYGIGWAVELIAVEAVFLFTYSLSILALVNIGLGLVVQGLGQVWQRQQSPTNRLSPLHTLPMAYGIIALILRASLIHPWTGFISVGMSLILITVGRQLSGWGRSFLYLGLLGLSLSTSELLLNQLTEVGWGDRGVALALLMAAFMTLYRGFRPQLAQYLQVPQQRVTQIAHGHWGVGTLVLGFAATAPISQPLLALVTGGLLTTYALLQSRSPDPSRETRTWLYLGVAQGYAVLTIGIAIAGKQTLILPWFGAIAVLLALGMRQAPWPAWGWHPQPWQQVARVLPVIVGVLTVNEVHPLSLLAIALFYGLLGQWERQVRWHYLGLAALCGLASQGLDAFEINAPILRLAPLTLSILYVTRVDPFFQDGKERNLRHQLRLGTLALFFAVTYFPSHWSIIGGISLLLILAGLSLKIRAFLFIGTAIFVVNVLEQFIILGTLYTLSKWILGLGFGVILIVSGAIFESKKPQIKTALNDYSSKLKDWE